MRRKLPAQRMHCEHFSGNGRRRETSSGTWAISFGPGDTDGIITTASASATPAGRFSFLQLVKSANATYYQTNGTQCHNNLSAGLDSRFPYHNSITPPTTNNAPTTTEDAPQDPMFADDTEVTVSDSFTTYVMWTPANVSNPIMVPIGSINWGWSGDAVQNLTTGVWTINTTNPKMPSNGSGGTFVLGNSYPVWTQFDAGGPPPCK